MESEQTKILTIKYSEDISQKEIPFFRGAVIQTVENSSFLFHNHDGEKFRYAYPLVQYKRINGKAAIVCVGNGTDCKDALLSASNFDCQLGKRNAGMRIESYNMDLACIGCDEEHKYQLHNWLPLNSKNYKQFQATESLVERIRMLEKVLVGNILSFLKGVDVHLDQQLNVYITKIADQHLTRYKRVKFDIEFNANIVLPPFIGLGKNASVGYGILTTIAH